MVRQSNEKKHEGVGKGEVARLGMEKRRGWGSIGRNLQACQVAAEDQNGITERHLGFLEQIIQLGLGEGSLLDLAAHGLQSAPRPREREKVNERGRKE